MRALEDAGGRGRRSTTSSCYPGGRWFGATPGWTSSSRIQCVLGEGVAGTLGEDAGKPRLEVGDTFQLGDLDWIVIGVMKTEGTTFGSEIWVQRFDRITRRSARTNVHDARDADRPDTPRRRGRWRTT